MASNIVVGVLFVTTVVSAFSAVYFWYLQRETTKRVNRRLVAYEGRLRDLGHEPERVYHDFENMLEGNVEDRQAEEFESDVRYDGEDDE